MPEEHTVRRAVLRVFIEAGVDEGVCVVRVIGFRQTRGIAVYNSLDSVSHIRRKIREEKVLTCSWLKMLLKVSGGYGYRPMAHSMIDNPKLQISLWTL